MRKIFIFTALLLLSLMAATAQDYSFNTYVGYTATGFARTNVTKFQDDDQSYKIESSPLTGFQLGISNINEGIILAYDLSYVTGPISNVTPNNYTASNTKDYLRIHFGTTIGWVLNSGHRLQFPIMAGPGFSWVRCGGAKTLMFDPAAKLRINFFLTRRIGIYAGAGGNAGIGLKGTRIGYTIEAGLIYGFDND